MNCSVRGITNSVVSENKDKTETNVRKAQKSSEVGKALATSTPMAILTELVKRTKPTLDGENVHILNISRNEDDQFVLKFKVGKSSEIIEMVAEDFSSFMTEAENFQLDKNHLERFHSDFDSIHTHDDFEELALGITNNPEKILEVAQSLIDADNYHNDGEHNRVLWDQLGLITNSLVEMVPNLNVHINNAGKANFGTIDVNTNDIYIAKGVGGSKSLMEIYVHELYHAVTHYAISSKETSVRKDTARIEQVREYFLANTKESDLVRMSGGKITTEQAASLLNHLTNPGVGLHEFVALAMTNKAIMNQLKTLDITQKPMFTEASLFHRILDAVYRIFGSISRRLANEPEGDDLQRMVFLVTRLHTAHKKPMEAKRLLGIRNLLSIFNPIERRFVDYVNKKIEEGKKDIGRNAPKENEGNAKFYARLAVRSFYDDQARDIIGNTLSLATFRGGYSPFAPEGTVRTILRDSFESDMTQDQVEAQGMISQNIDQQREFRAIQTAEVILKSFSRDLTEEEEIALTDTVLDTDLSAIYYNYDVASLLEDNNKIRKAEDAVVKKLKALTDGESVNFYEAQTELLAAYMIQGTDNIALLLNADNIAKKMDTTNEDLNVSKEIINLVDELASLKALRRVNKKQKATLRKLIDEEAGGIDNLVAFQFGQKKYAEREVFPTMTDKMKIIKGYSAQITDPDIDVTIAPVSKQAELKAQGFVLKKTLVKHNMDGNKTPMALYVNNRFISQRFHRVGLRITDKARRGTTVTESYSMGSDSNPTLKAAADIRRMRERRAEVVKLMMSGQYKAEDVESDGLVTPNLNNSGRVKDFRYGMDKQIKLDILDMERKVSTVMGRTAASTYDKKATDNFNKQLLDLIIQDATDNLKPGQVSVIGKNQKEYIKIEKNSLNKQVADLWRILPEAVKKEFPEGFTLRRDLMHSYLGYREMSITDIPILKGFLETNPRAYKAAIKYALQFAGKLWQELIKISKADIIIRTPGVFIGNVVSNFMLMYVSGYSFKEITRLKYQGVKELKLYVDGLKESLQLEAKDNAGILTVIERRRLNVIKNNLINSPVKDLVDEGFYTTIIEEMEHGSDSGSYFNKLAKKKLQKVPKIFSDGVDLLYITENTKLFKLIEKSIQASDFAARYAQYHLMIEKGVKKEKAVKIVRDNFINYNKPNSRFMEWANQMGFVMFTKYFTRIQRVIRDYGKNHPAKVMLSILAQDYVLGDIDDFSDQSVLTKDMGNLFYNPFDNLLRVITPTSAEAVDWVLNGGR